MRWLGIDLGTRRIGVAIGDEQMPVASPAEVIQRRASDNDEDIFRQIADLARDFDAGGVVVGWPLNMDSTEGDQGVYSRKFAAALAEKTGLVVRLWDERLSSAAADDKLARTFTRKKKKARQDAVAASVILQDFLTLDGPNTAVDPAAYDNGEKNAD